MAEEWTQVAAGEVKAGDTIRLASGVSLVVSRVEPAFMGRPEMVAFIQDTADGWFKQPMPVANQVEVRAGA